MSARSRVQGRHQKHQSLTECAQAYTALRRQSFKNLGAIPYERQLDLAAVLAVSLRQTFWNLVVLLILNSMKSSSSVCGPKSRLSVWPSGGPV